MIDGRPRFLIVRLGSLGDVIHAIPAAAALRRRFPQAQIDWLVDPRYLPLLRLVSGLDERIPVDPRGSVPALLSAVAKLRRARYDATLDLQGLVKSAVMARAAGGHRTIGFDKRHLREPAARMFYSETVDPGGSGGGNARDAGDVVHVIERNLRLVGVLGVTDVRAMFPLIIARTAAAEAVTQLCGSEGYVLLNPGAAWPNKRWPVSRFGQLASMVRDRHGVRSVVVWGPDERTLADAVVAESDGAALASPPTSIEDLFAIAQRARLIVSGDTGPLHIGGAVGTPLVSLFGPTRWARNGPWSPADVALSRTDRCVCLYERRCRLATPCIDDIGVDEVVAAVDRRLALA